MIGLISVVALLSVLFACLFIFELMLLSFLGIFLPVILLLIAPIILSIVITRIVLYFV